MYDQVFEELLAREDQQADDSYDRCSTPQAQEVVIGMQKITTNREARLMILSDVLGRPINSTKELRVGEINAFKKLLDNPHFVSEMKDEYRG